MYEMWRDGGKTHMSRLKRQLDELRGYCGIVMYQPKIEHNWGSLMRTAAILGVDFIATVGPRFHHQASDTVKSWRHVPVFRFKDIDDLVEHLPYGCPLIGIEMSDESVDLKTFKHPQRACYILGAEDNGLPVRVQDMCHHLIKLKGDVSMNVSIAGSIVLYDRIG